MTPLSISLLLIVSLLSVSLQAKQSNHHEIKKPCQEPHFVLVHGHGGGAWSWYKIISRLESAGYNVTALDLKGAGIDLTDTKTIQTFEDYNKPLIDYLQKLSDDEKVFLVGHSAGGLSITDASYKFSKKIQVAIYVAAAMFKHGAEGLPKTNMEPMIRRGRYLLAGVKSHNPIIRQIISQEDAVSKRILYRNLLDEVLTNTHFEGDGADSVKRVYIKTLYDETFLPQKQDDMIREWPPEKVFEVECGHEILVSDPSLLVDLLLNIAKSTNCDYK